MGEFTDDCPECRVALVWINRKLRCRKCGYVGATYTVHPIPVDTELSPKLILALAQARERMAEIKRQAKGGS